MSKNQDDVKQSIQKLEFNISSFAHNKKDSAKFVHQGTGSKWQDEKGFRKQLGKDLKDTSANITAKAEVKTEKKYVNNKVNFNHGVNLTKGNAYIAASGQTRVPVVSISLGDKSSIELNAMKVEAKAQISEEGIMLNAGIRGPSVKGKTETPGVCVKGDLYSLGLEGELGPGAGVSLEAGKQKNLTNEGSRYRFGVGIGYGMAYPKLSASINQYPNHPNCISSHDESNKQTKNSQQLVEPGYLISNQSNGEHKMRNSRVMFQKTDQKNKEVKLKYDLLISSCNRDSSKIASIDAIYKKYHLENQQKLSAIQRSALQNNTKLQNILSYVGDIHNEMLNRRSKEQSLEMQAATLAQFQGVISGFNAIADIGASTNNKSLQVFGAIGMSVTQGALGIAQLTGSFGMTAASGLSMLTPATAIIGSIFTLSQLIMRKKGSSDGRALQSVIDRIDNLHRDMMRGFGIVIENQKITIDLIVTGFKNVDERLYQIIRQNNRMEEKLDNIQNSLNNIQATLQEQTLNDKLNELRSLINKVELICFNEISHDNNQSSAKCLQKIRDSLEYSQTANCKGLKNFGNNLSGWFYLDNLKILFNKPEFIDVEISVDNVCNFIWWQKTIELYVQIFPFINRSSSAVNILEQKVCDSLNKSIKHNHTFIEKITSPDFLDNFMQYYIEKLEQIKNKANKMLSHMQKTVGEQGALSLAEEYLTSDSSMLQIQAIEENSKQAAEAYINNKKYLCDYVRDFNTLLEQFRFFISILHSLFEVETNIVNKLVSLRPVHTDEFQDLLVKDSKKNIKGREIRLFYIDNFKNNLFPSINITTEDKEEIKTKIKNNSNEILNYINNIDLFLSLSRLSHSFNTISLACCDDTALQASIMRR